MSLLTDVLVGLYIGALTGIFPALVAWGLAFVFRYFTGVTVPGFGVVVLGVAIAGIQGGLLGLLDSSVVNSPAALVALLIVMMATMYAHNRGDQMGAEFPRRVTLKDLRDRTLSRDVVERMGGFGQVRIRVRDVTDVEGYPPLPEDFRTSIAAGEWTFPADLPVSELEDRVAARLVTEHDLAEVVVTIDQKGRATVAAAPAPGGLSRRVPEGERAVSIDALVPTGVARGEAVTLLLPDATVRGTVVSAESGDGVEPAPSPESIESEPNGTRNGTENRGGFGVDEETEGEESVEPPARAPTTRGGDGRITVAVAREDAKRVLAADSATLVVRSRGTRLEFELVSMLVRAGKRFRKLAVPETTALAGRTLREADVRSTHGVVVLAVRKSSGWVVSPRGDTTLVAGDELIVVGSRADLETLQEAVA